MVVVEAVASTIACRGRMPPGVIYQDLVSWGVEGLIKAKNNFDPERGAQFRTYANFRIRGEILDNLRKEWSYRSPSTYKEYQEKIKDRIIEVVEGAIESESDMDNAKRVNDLLNNSATVYILSLDELSLNSVANIEDTTQDFEADFQNSEDKTLLWEEVDKLDEEEREIIIMFYAKGKKQKDISNELKLSKSKVCRMHNKILEKLKRRVMRRLEN